MLDQAQGLAWEFKYIRQGKKIACILRDNYNYRHWDREASKKQKELQEIEKGCSLWLKGEGGPVS